jgi:hypothetical protein
MKINRLETHDRLLHLKKDQSDIVSKGCQDCLKSNPLSLALQEHSDYIYIFAHPRTAEDGFTKVLYWQPRLAKPHPQTNSYLFRAQSRSDNLEICWILPPEEMWGQYKKGNVTESDVILWSIDQYINHKEEMKKAFEGDLSRDQIHNIYRKIGRDMEDDAIMKKVGYKKI